MTQTLTDLFRDKKRRSDAETTDINWEQRKRDWIAAIDLLYADVARLLKEPVQQGAATLVRRTREITEDHLGTYPVEDLVVGVGDERVTFAPRARNVIGAAGRVDVRGERAEGMLIVQPGPRWMVVASPYPSLNTVNLDAESLAELLASVMRP